MYGRPFFFITIVREKLANRGKSSRISVNSCPIRAAFGIFLTDEAAFTNVILLIVMTYCAIPAELSLFPRIFVSTSYLNRD